MVDLSKDSQARVIRPALRELEEVRVVTRHGLRTGPGPTPRAAAAAASSAPDFFSKRRSAFRPAAFFFVVSQGGLHG